jgi:hypothetical protein
MDVLQIPTATEIAKSQDHLFLVAKRKGNMIEIKNVIG